MMLHKSSRDTHCCTTLLFCMFYLLQITHQFLDDSALSFRDFVRFFFSHWKKIPHLSTLWSSRPVDDRMICLFNRIVAVCLQDLFWFLCLLSPHDNSWASHWCCNHCQYHFSLNKIFNLLSFISNGTDDVQPLNSWIKLILRPCQLSCSAMNCCDFQNNKLSVEIIEIKAKITLLMTACLFHFSYVSVLWRTKLLLFF